MKRIYIAGPMTGLPDLNFPAFNAAAAQLRAVGYHVENPAEINPDKEAEWIDCMERDLPQLMTCDAVFALPGWRNSKGARIEVCVARAKGMEVIEQ